MRAVVKTLNGREVVEEAAFSTEEEALDYMQHRLFKQQIWIDGRLCYEKKAWQPYITDKKKSPPGATGRPKEKQMQIQSNAGKTYLSRSQAMALWSVQQTGRPLNPTPAKDIEYAYKHQWDFKPHPVLPRMLEINNIEILEDTNAF